MQYTPDKIADLIHDLGMMQGNVLALREMAQRAGEDVSQWEQLPDAFAEAPKELVNQTIEMRVAQTPGASTYEIGGWTIPVYEGYGGELTLEQRRRLDARYCYGSPEAHARQAFRHLYGDEKPFGLTLARAWGLIEIPQRLSSITWREHP